MDNKDLSPDYFLFLVSTSPLSAPYSNNRPVIVIPSTNNRPVIIDAPYPFQRNVPMCCSDGVLLRWSAAQIDCCSDGVLPRWSAAQMECCSDGLLLSCTVATVDVSVGSPGGDKSRIKSFKKPARVS